MRDAKGKALVRGSQEYNAAMRKGYRRMGLVAMMIIAEAIVLPRYGRPGALAVIAVTGGVFLLLYKLFDF